MVAWGNWKLSLLPTHLKYQYSEKKKKQQLLKEIFDGQYPSDKKDISLTSS